MKVLDDGVDSEVDGMSHGGGSRWRQRVDGRWAVVVGAKGAFVGVCLCLATVPSWPAWRKNRLLTG